MDGARAVLAAHNKLADRLGAKRPDGLQNLQLLVAHGGGIKGGGWLQRHHGDELQNVVLDHVADRPRGFIKRGTALDPQTFRGGDLDVIHIPAVPQRLEDSVAEAEDQ